MSSTAASYSRLPCSGEDSDGEQDEADANDGGGAAGVIEPGVYPTAWGGDFRFTMEKTQLVVLFDRKVATHTRDDAIGASAFMASTTAPPSPLDEGSASSQQHKAQAQAQAQQSPSPEDVFDSELYMPYVQPYSDPYDQLHQSSGVNVTSVTSGSPASFQSYSRYQPEQGELSCAVR